MHFRNGEPAGKADLLLPPTKDLRADGWGYELYIGRWSRLLAGEFLKGLAVLPVVAGFRGNLCQGRGSAAPLHLDC